MPNPCNAGNNYLIDSEFYGYYNALTNSEHTTLQDIRFDACIIPWTIANGSGSYYGVSATNVQMNGCYHGIYAHNGTVTVDIRHLNVEHAQGSNSEDILDSSNYLIGVISSDITTLAVTGGTNVRILTAKMFNASFLGEFGSCTMASGTCSAQSLAHTYGSAPVCIVTWTGSGTLAGMLKVASTATTVTPASSNSGDTAVVNWYCVSSAMTQ
jgi:hypothetical protein